MTKAGEEPGNEATGLVYYNYRTWYSFLSSAPFSAGDIIFNRSYHYYITFRTRSSTIYDHLYSAWPSRIQNSVCNYCITWIVYESKHNKQILFHPRLPKMAIIPLPQMLLKLANTICCQITTIPEFEDYNSRPFTFERKSSFSGSSAHFISDQLEKNYKWV